MTMVEQWKLETPVTIMKDQSAVIDRMVTTRKEFWQPGNTGIKAYNVLADLSGKPRTLLCTDM